MSLFFRLKPSVIFSLIELEQAGAPPDKLIAVFF